jgi:hypothetical protein
LEHVTVTILDDAGDRRDEMFVLAIIKYLLLVSYVGIEGQILNRAVVQYVTGRWIFVEGHETKSRNFFRRRVCCNARGWIFISSCL